MIWSREKHSSSVIPSVDRPSAGEQGGHTSCFTPEALALLPPPAAAPGAARFEPAAVLEQLAESGETFHGRG